MIFVGTTLILMYLTKSLYRGEWWMRGRRSSPAEEPEAEFVDEDRRSFLNIYGKAALVAPPVITMLLATSMSSRAIAQSTGGIPGGGGGGGGGGVGIPIAVVGAGGSALAAAPHAAPAVLPVQEVAPVVAPPPIPQPPPMPLPPPPAPERG